MLQETLEANGIEGKVKDSLIGLDDSVLPRTVCLFFSQETQDISVHRRVRRQIEICNVADRITDALHWLRARFGADRIYIHLVYIFIHQKN